MGKIMRVGNFILSKEKAGVISKEEICICIYSCYLHANESLVKLLYEVVTEYKHDRHLVG